MAERTTVVQIDRSYIEHFTHGQVAAWNARDKATFMGLYRKVASDGLDVEYVGQSKQRDGWFVIEEMWDKHNGQIQLEVVTTIINGNVAAVHHHNCIAGTDQIIESIETYTFAPGRLAIRYFLKPPSVTLNLRQFRGFSGEL